MRVYEAIVRGLEGVGVGAAFGGAGENAAGLMLALKHSASIRPVITRHEQAASFMACGYAMYSGRLGVCFATAGPGAFNLFSGLAVAMSDSYPVLAISGFASLDWKGKGALNETSGVSRTPDSQEMFAATTKKSFLLDDAAKTCDVLEEAVNLAFEGRPGPVHIHVPENLTHRPHHRRQLSRRRSARETNASRPGARRGRRRPAGRRLVEGQEGAGADRLRRGPQQRRPGTESACRTLPDPVRHDARRQGHHFAKTIRCRSAFSATAVTSRACKAFLAADVVLAVGNSFAQHATFGFRDDLFEDRKLVHINIDIGEIDKVYKADAAIIADAKPAIAALTARMLDACSTRHRRGRSSGMTTSEQRITHLISKIHPGQLAQALSRQLPDNAIVLADAGAHLAWLGYYLELSSGQSFRKPGGFGPMAGNVNGALGVKCAHPDRPVIVGCGDGCYLLSGFELLTAVQYDIPVIWIIFNDNEFKLIKLYQLSAYGEIGAGGVRKPRLRGLRRGLRRTWLPGRDPGRVRGRLTEALALGKPAIIDAHITRLALPVYSPSPEGLLAGVVEMIEDRFHPG